jgi:hypothetical protein
MRVLREIRRGLALSFALELNSVPLRTDSPMAVGVHLNQRLPFLSQLLPLGMGVR